MAAIGAADRRARAEIGRADLVLYVVDATIGIGDDERAELPVGSATLVVWNKTDLPPFSTLCQSCSRAARPS